MLFKTSNEYGNIPYDGLRIYSLWWPRHRFISWALGMMDEAGRRWRHHDKDEKLWRYFISLPVNGAPGALRVGWGPTWSGRGIPRMMLLCNPSTAGLSPNETLALIRWVLDAPENERLAELATKLDFEGRMDEIDARLYLPGVRSENRQYGDETHIHGARKGNQLRPYDKGRESGGAPHQVARVEITEHFRTRDKLRLERPTLRAFLPGGLIECNGLRRVKAVDLAAVGDDQLTAMALELGLTEAIRRGLPERPDRYGRMRAPSMQNIRRLVNANADDTLLFSLYREQAVAWHSQFDRAAADNLEVVWSDDLGLEIVAKGTSTLCIPA